MNYDVPKNHSGFTILLTNLCLSFRVKEQKKRRKKERNNRSEDGKSTR